MSFRCLRISVVTASNLLLWYRSPSPPPQYDNFGRRVNTREYRYRKRLEDERHKLVEKAMKMIPNYHPPADYRRPTKLQEKVYVPVNDYPEINFSMITNPLTFLIMFICPASLSLLDSSSRNIMMPRCFRSILANPLLTFLPFRAFPIVTQT